MVRLKEKTTEIEAAKLSFQFLMVRLKDRHLPQRVVLPLISIPYGSIKSQSIARRICI